MRRPSIAAVALLAQVMMAAPAAAESRHALRFHGTGTNQQDRIRIAIDDDQPGPDGSAPCGVVPGSPCPAYPVCPNFPAG